ncbi:hypothetical protein CFP56_014329 [Quercus suber]|uniref:Uncharacterized protein n=1 Tax=Quercus suber TaxID=58331 RepID=A0AAW0KTP0_QUESU
MVMGTALSPLSPQTRLYSLSSSSTSVFFSATSNWQEHHGLVLTGRKYSLSLKPHQRLSHPHSLFFSETPTTTTCSTIPIPTHFFAAKDHRFYHPSFQGSDFFQWVLSNPSSSEINDCDLGKISEEMAHFIVLYSATAVGKVSTTTSFEQKQNTNIPNGFQEKAAPIEKLPMFAFCLKPQGLEVPNKGKFSVSGQSNAILGDQDGFHAFGIFLHFYIYTILFRLIFPCNLFLNLVVSVISGRRLNGFAFADDKFVYLGHSHSYESHELSP